MSPFQVAQYVEKVDGSVYTSMLDFWPYVKELINQPTSLLFQMLKNLLSAIESGCIIKLGSQGHLQVQNWCVNFLSRKEGETYDGIVFNSSNHNSTIHMAKLHLHFGMGLAKMLHMENHEVLTCTGKPTGGGL